MFMRTARESNALTECILFLGISNLKLIYLSCQVTEQTGRAPEGKRHALYQLQRHSEP